MFAALNIYKPLELTSHDVVARLRRAYGLKRIGHLGTLDPLAEGVLPVCLGQATRLIEYFPSDKRYRAEVTLGRTTTTLDREGEVLTETDCRLMDPPLDFSNTQTDRQTGNGSAPDRLHAVLSQLTGVIQQQVPLYSAVHVGGKKLYELARKGQTADLPVRETTIHELTLLGVNADNPAHPVLTLDVHCASGTYIRSLARDIGEALGCGAYLSALVRTAHGRFTLDTAIPLETIQQAAEAGASDQLAGYLLNPTDYLAIPLLPLTSTEEARLLSHGMRIDPPPESRLKSNETFLATFERRPVAVVTVVRHTLKPLKVFPESKS